MSIALNLVTSGATGVGFATITLQSQGNYGSDTNYMLDYVLTNQTSPLDAQLLNLSTGNTTINATNCPAIASAGGVWVVPPLNNGTILTLKGAAGDTGIALNLTAPAFIPFGATPPTSFVLSITGTVTGLRLIWV